MVCYRQQYATMLKPHFHYFVFYHNKEKKFFSEHDQICGHAKPHFDLFFTTNNHVKTFFQSMTNSVTQRKAKALEFEGKYEIKLEAGVTGTQLLLNLLVLLTRAFERMLEKFVNCFSYVLEILITLSPLLTCTTLLIIAVRSSSVSNAKQDFLVLQCLRPTFRWVYLVTLSCSFSIVATQLIIFFIILYCHLSSFVINIKMNIWEFRVIHV